MQVVVALPITEAAQLIAAANAVIRNLPPEKRGALRDAARRLAEQSGIPYHGPDDRN